jgi:hypothetical protein
MFGACEQAMPTKGSTYYGYQTLTTGIVVEIYSIFNKGGYTALVIKNCMKEHGQRRSCLSRATKNFVVTLVT